MTYTYDDIPELTERFSAAYLKSAIEDCPETCAPNYRGVSDKVLPRVHSFSMNFLIVNGDLIGENIEQCARDLWHSRNKDDLRGPEVRLTEFYGLDYWPISPPVGFSGHPDLWKENEPILSRVARSLGIEYLYLADDGFLYLSND